MTSSLDPDAFRRFEHEGWQRKALGYHALFSTVSWHVVDRLLDAVEAEPGKYLLDIGSGPGYVVAAAHNRRCKAFAVDFASAMAKLGRTLHPECSFGVGDAHALPFADGTFDCVTGNFVFHHIARQELALREIGRVLVSGGRLGLTAWASPDRNRFLGLFVDAVRESGAAIPPDLPPGPPMAGNDEDYRTQLELAGFAEPLVEHVEWRHRFASPAALWNGLLAASVRTAALIELQPPHIQDSVRHQFNRQASAYTVGGFLDVPVAATLFGGRLTRL